MAKSWIQWMKTMKMLLPSLMVELGREWGCVCLCVVCTPGLSQQVLVHPGVWACVAPYFHPHLGCSKEP